MKQLYTLVNPSFSVARGRSQLHRYVSVFKSRIEAVIRNCYKQNYNANTPQLICAYVFAYAKTGFLMTQLI